MVIFRFDLEYLIEKKFIPGYDSLCVHMLLQCQHSAQSSHDNSGWASSGQTYISVNTQYETNTSSEIIHASIKIGTFNSQIPGASLL